MFFLSDGALVYSASDLATAAVCEFALLRALDARLGRIAPLELAADAMLARTARLGNAHEQSVLQGYRDAFGPWDPATGTGVVEIERPVHALATDRATLEAKHGETLTALRTGADVVYQAGFFDGRFGGWADFLVRAPQQAGTPSVYAVYDTKLARHAKVTALLQLAAYADQLITAGITPADHVHLVLGDRTTTSHRLADLLPVFRDRRARLQALLDGHRSAEAPIAWADPHFPRLRACGRCEVCAPEIVRTRDLLLVAGLRGTQRTRLREAGITTIDQLAAGDGATEAIKIGTATLVKLRAQAALQVRQGERAENAVQFDLFAPEVVRALPAADPGDLFFDFEGDPLWAEAGSTDWGLEYLFGVVEQPARPDVEPVFRSFWAHDRAEEKRALLDFLAYVSERRATYPDLHIYHYAAYEKSALQRLAGRHGVGEEAVADLLRDGVLVDLYTTVRASLRVGQDSYSIKKLEPLYMPPRTGEVTNAAASIVEYADACAVRDDGDVDGPDGFTARIQRIADYNRDDCVSTLRLRDWLVAAAGDLPPTGEPDGPAGTPDPTDGVVDALPPERDTTADALTALVGEGSASERSDDQQALAMLAASLGYHWREETPFWWGHFDRLRADPEDWTDPRGTLVADDVEVLEDWAVPPGKRNARRRLRLLGRLEPGSELRAGAEVVTLFDTPVPDAAKVGTSGTRGSGGTRGWMTGARVVRVAAGASDPDGVPERDELIVDESLPVTFAPHSGLPMGLGPSAPPNSASLRQAIRDLADDVVGKLTATGAATPTEITLPDLPALDLLRRVPPRTRSGRPLPTVGDGPRSAIDAITAALLDLDHSYLAVQGPPGTGKTYAGSHVIANLVARGWRIGVVAQSHAVVENMLTAVRAAGVVAEQIGKKPAQGAGAGAAVGVGVAPWHWLKDNRAFDTFYAAQADGFVVGGTVWDFTNANRLPPEGLDLLVIDEAGQFCLANTVAVWAAARNLLLLGDPQQLPQVSQGKHPEPVDGSALGWLADGHETLPDALGYFLAKTWRLHPDLCRVVSRLSYEGRLTSMPITAERSLEGVLPGVRTVFVEHTGHAVSSIEEADEVVRQVIAVVGRRWRDGDEERLLEPADVVVVAAYNAQRWTIRRALDTAHLAGVRVGTVDKFQGQQAPVVILSMAASSAQDVPRGMEFLLSRNRINVAISRGMWCAIIVRSPTLTDFLPTRPDGLAELGAFLGLCGDAAGARLRG